MEKQISIIIPTYNMEAYIGKCLDSLLIPEFDQVEVLVVNDGSKDRSSEIAHSYADRYPESIRVIDKPNGNYGSCINAALPQCTGRYVKVLDADDTFDTAAFSKFVRTLATCNEDAIITEYNSLDDSDKIIAEHNLNDWNIPIATKLNIQDITALFDTRYIEMHRLAYRLAILRHINYRQTEGISYTDTEWAIIPFFACKTIKFLKISVYKYLYGRIGQTTDPEKIAKSIPHFITVLQRLNSYYRDSSTDNRVRKALFMVILNRHKYVYTYILQAWNASTARCLRNYEASLKTDFEAMYKATEAIVYSNEVKFKYIKDIRRKNYPETYKVPLYVFLQLSAVIRIKRLRKYFTR